MRMKI